MNELSYSFHLGNDKNKSKKSRQSIKNGKVKDKVFNNNAIQNANHLSRVNKHNLRKYDDNTNLIEIIYGTNNLYNDVKNLYKKEFVEARIKYNKKQTRNDRKIENYFEHISKNDKSDLACEIIIELGDMEFWKDKNDEFKRKMTDVFREQINDLEKIVPSFKIANATIHYDESSPHLHIVGVPIKKGNKNGMEIQVGKSTIFTKESLRTIQDTMRVCCINSFNKVYNLDKQLKIKLKGRGEDYATKDMAKKYRYLKRNADINRKRLKKANQITNTTLEKTQQVKTIVSNLKPTKFAKNNYVISNDDINTINDYIENVKTNVSEIKDVNDLTNIIEDYENVLKSHHEQVDKFQETLDEKDRVIKLLESSNKRKQNTIDKNKKKIDSLNKNIKELNLTISGLLEIIEDLKTSWKKLLNFLRDKLFSFKKEDIIYENVINEMINTNILNDEDIDYLESDNENNNDIDYEV